MTTKKASGIVRPAALLASFRKKFGRKLSAGRIDRREHILSKKRVVESVWFTIDRKALADAVKHLSGLYPDPHFAVASGYDAGDDIVMNYHFTVNYASDLKETRVSMTVRLPKKDPVVPTITGAIPGALISEREMQEMLGVTVEGIPDPRRLFLEESFPKGVYPWRRDETGPEKLVRNLHEDGKGRGGSK